MTKFGEHTYFEIRSQTKAWAQALEVVRSQKNEFLQIWHSHPGTKVLFTGCGSTHYLSWAAASLFQELTKRESRPIPAGELILYPSVVYADKTPFILVAISRSGTTTETIVAVQQFKKTNRGPVIVITNYEDTPLVELADLSIVIPEGQENSVAQTRSFASMYMAATALAVVAAGNEGLLDQMKKLPIVGDQLIKKYDGLARSLGENLHLDRFYFLGSGPRYGLACETNLKMKEMTLTHSEPFHFFEFRHGPMSMVTNTTAIIGLLSSVKCNYEQSVLDEMQRLDACILSLSESNADVAFESDLPEEIRNVLYLPVLQLTAYYRSLAKGLNPDKPQNLTAVVHLDLV